MPSNDLVINVRQIAGYGSAAQAQANDQILIQRNGLGGPYLSISPGALVGSALTQGGDMVVGGQLRALSVQSGSGQFSNGAFGLLSADNAILTELSATYGSLAGAPIATQPYADAGVAGLRAQTVWSVNGRRGDIRLSIWDVCGAAPIYSPWFTGQPQAETPSLRSHSNRLATTAFVHLNIVGYLNQCLKSHPFVFSFNGRTGEVVLTQADMTGIGVITNPNVDLTGIPTAPTAAPGTSSTQIATTAFVTSSITNLDLSAYAPIDSPNFSGHATAPTAAPGTSTPQIATTAFVMNAIVASTTGVATFNSRTGDVVLQASDVTGVGGALLAGPAFTGIPTAPTAAPNTNTTQLATCQFVTAALTGATNVVSVNGRSGAVVIGAADITGAGGALLMSPALTGIPTAPTASPGTSTGQLATTAFVEARVGGLAGVASFNGRTGAVNLMSNDVSAAGGALLVSPAFTGVPTGPTAAVNTATTQLATTAFVQNQIVAVDAGVTTFNGRSGAVTLSGSDVSAAGGALLASPALLGTPTAPTAVAATSTTQLATTAFVQTAVKTAPGVTDGSNAPAGVVGEYLITTEFAGPPGGSSGQSYPVATLALAAGDWDVGADLVWGLFGATGLSQAGAVIDATGATMQGAPAYWLNWEEPGSQTTAWGGPVGVGRVTSAAPFTVTLHGQISWTTASSIVAQGSLWARRMR